YEAVQADNPIAYWRLGEPSDGKAYNEGSLGARVDGDYNGGPNRGQPSLVPNSTNTSVTFLGNNERVEIPDDDAINDSGPYAQKTIEAWFSLDPDAGGRDVIYEQGGQTEGLNLYTRKTGGDFYIRNGAWLTDPDDGTTQRNHFPAQVQIDTDTAYHAVSVYDADDNSMILYLDGAAVAGKNAGNIQEIGKHGSDVAIGRKQQGTRFDNGGSGSNGNEFDGTLDEVALYNEAITMRSVQTHYVAGTSDRLGITPGATLGVMLNYDATIDGDGNTTWEDTIGSRRNNANTDEYNWDLGNPGDIPRVSTQSVLLPGIAQAYQFDGNTVATTRSFEDLAGSPDDNSASFELVFKPDDLSAESTIFETGGNTDGTAFWMENGELHFDVKDSGNNARATFDLTTLSEGAQADFFHVVGVADLENNLAQLYVNGLLRTDGTSSGDINDWSGGGAGDVGLGGTANEIPFSNHPNFVGEIGLFRFYPSILSADDVLANRAALVPEPSTYVLALIGLAGLAMFGRRRRNGR
ncbi:MAG: PEP-CTERM sorting domain-containing protein, partial [Planctomycetes bacterium]|nr:PEP-CTERM sorting domain-containing protein [Planctomycetota bacterium]